MCLITAYFSDHLRLRLPFIAFGVVLTVAGLATLMTVHHQFHTQYAALFLVAMGTFSAGPVVICWYVMNLRGHTERSVGTAWMIGFGNCGGIISTFAFLAKDAPLYHTGYSICLAMVCLGALAAAAYGGLLLNDNRTGRVSGGGKGGREYYTL